jgi:hypothetical protein
MKKKVEKWISIDTLNIGDVVRLKTDTDKCEYEITFTHNDQVVFISEEQIIVRTINQLICYGYEKKIIEEITELVDGVGALKAYKEGKKIQKGRFVYYMYNTHARFCKTSPCTYNNRLLPDFTQDDWEIID